MKRLLMLSAGLFFLNTAIAQLPKQISPADLSKIKLKVNAEAEARKKKLLNDPNRKDDLSDIVIGFQTDTMKIEQFMKRRLDIDYSTAGMVEAAFDAEKEYDLLLNKYYQQLLKKLKVKDKPVLIEAQKSWIKYRDAERKLNGLLREDIYSGGGTMQRIIYSGASLEFTKKRVAELNSYLEHLI